MPGDPERARPKGERAQRAGWSSDHHLFVTQTRCKALVLARDRLFKRGIGSKI
jgi:hypothetical protein